MLLDSSRDCVWPLHCTFCMQAGHVCTVRCSRGDDEMAACGQLGGVDAAGELRGRLQQAHQARPPEAATASSSAATSSAEGTEPPGSCTAAAGVPPDLPGSPLGLPPAPGAELTSRGISEPTSSVHQQAASRYLGTARGVQRRPPARPPILTPPPRFQELLKQQQQQQRQQQQQAAARN